MKHAPQYLSGMTVFIDGVGLLGTARQVTLPKVEQMRETVTAGGFERSQATGVFKAMEAELALSEYHAQAYQAANRLAKPLTFVVKGSLTQKGENKAVVATLKGTVDIDDGALETGKEAERKVKIYVDYYALEIGDKEQCLLDAENMIARISGTDLLEAVRSHIL